MKRKIDDGDIVCHTRSIEKEGRQVKGGRENRLYFASLVFIIMSTLILSIKLHNEYIAKRKDFSLSGCTMSLAAAPVAWTREEVDRCPSTRVPSPRICESLFLSYKDTLKFQYLFFTFQCFRSQSSSSSSLHSELHFTVSYLTKL